jgi:K+-transporting ATPase ATPase B chain
VCLIQTTIGALLSPIGIAGMDRMIRKNVIGMSGRAVEAAGDVNVLLLDKTGTITLGNRQATAFVPAPGGDRGPTRPRGPTGLPGRRDVGGAQHRVLAKERFQLRERDIQKFGATFVPFTAQTRMSRVNLDGRQVRKGAAEASMRPATPHSAVLSAVIFNALIIVALIPLALSGVRYRPIGAAAVLRRNLWISGVSGASSSRSPAGN